MAEEQSIIGKILAKYPVITEEEQQVLNDWLTKNGNQQKFNLLSDVETRKADLTRFLQIKKRKEENREKYYAAIANLTTKRKVVWWNRWQTYVAAASVIVILGIAAYKWLGGKKGVAVPGAPQIVQIKDVKPGQFKAKLILDDNTVIILDSIAEGKMVQQGSTHVINKDGQLVYQEQGNTNKIFYNALVTGKGETYGTVLSDGTKVWLNSQSSVRYPVAFTGDLRQVEVTGEAYFEVAPSVALLAGGKKIKRPFVVNAPGLSVEVLGTHFNVNSYGDEDAVRTTLLEGKVNVHSKSNNATTILQPGQQAILNKQSQQLNKIDNIDVDEAVAWHYGYFQFNRENLQTVMRQIVRWYDVDVVYQGNIPVRAFGGKISRSNSLLEVLKTLESNDVHFRLEGKRIIVSP